LEGSLSILMLVIITTLLAGIAMPIGALIARAEHIHSKLLKEEVRHAVMAFGGGALLSAVALVLVPDGIKHSSMAGAAIFFVLGSFCFMALDIYLQKINTPASLLAAMLADFIPESIALGAAFANGNSNAFLLAGLITLQNLPEGYNAYRELITSHTIKPGKIIAVFSVMAILGPIAGISGFIWLANYPQHVSSLMLFAAGGILYSIFQDIAPRVKLEKHWFPPIGAVLGFLLGMMGFMLSN
jgi:ZIP family zinc transporter